MGEQETGKKPGNVLTSCGFAARCHGCRERKGRLKGHFKRWQIKWTVRSRVVVASQCSQQSTVDIRAFRLISDYAHESSSVLTVWTYRLELSNSIWSTTHILWSLSAVVLVHTPPKSSSWKSHSHVKQSIIPSESVQQVDDRKSLHCPLW